MKCQICGDDREENFYRSITSFCKAHWKERVRQNRQARLDYYRAYDRERGNRQGYGYTKRYRKENAAKYRAHCAVNNAIRSGKVKRGEKCEACGATERLVAHHDDYSKPLEVRWLCSGCHHQWHAAHGEAKNGKAQLVTQRGNQQ